MGERDNKQIVKAEEKIEMSYCDRVVDHALKIMKKVAYFQTRIEEKFEERKITIIYTNIYPCLNFEKECTNC